MSREQAIAQGWHGPEWDRMSEEQREQSLRRASSALTQLAVANIGGTLLASGYIFDPTRKMILRSEDNADMGISKKEFDLAYYLAARSGKVCPTADVLRAVWGVAHVSDTQYLRVFLNTMRAKLPMAHIVTHRGIGVEWARSF